MTKTYLSILIFLLCFLDIYAQKLNVESFVAKTNDITARTQPRQDINGNDCALVKVRLAAENASFSGNVVGDVAYDKSEYFVYMPLGSKRLTIKLDGYLPLDVSFSGYGINSLEEKTVYVLTLSGVTGTQQLEAPKTKTGWIILDSEPSGASVYINEEFVGNTPLSNYKQAYGTYQYRLESLNYHPATGTIELNSGRFEQKVVLKPAFGSISVKSSIAGAKIVLDGKQTGKQTPTTLTEIPSGKHTITLQMDKYAPRQQEVIVEDGQTANVSMTLDARFARITINTLDGAEIYSNGKLMGKGHILEDMMEGYYDLEARLDHHKSVTKQIQVVAGQSQDITLNPIPKYGSLDVMSTPYGATVIIDGNNLGKTPMTIEHTLEGKHKLEIKMEGYYLETLDVIIEENKLSSVNVMLKVKTTENKKEVSNIIPPRRDISKEMLPYVQSAINGDEKSQAILYQNMDDVLNSSLIVQKLSRDYIPYSSNPNEKWNALRCEASAICGNIKAIKEIAERYKEGNGVIINSDKAFVWLEKAAEQDPQIMYEISMTYFERHNEEKGIYWLIRSADSGYPEARNLLGYYYKNGIHVSKDKKKAKMYLGN